MQKRRIGYWSVALIRTPEGPGEQTFNASELRLDAVPALRIWQFDDHTALAGEELQASCVLDFRCQFSCKRRRRLCLPGLVMR